MQPNSNSIRIPSFRPSLGQEESEAVLAVMQNRWLGIGKVTARFEHSLREFLGAKFVIATTSGTAALHLALKAIELTPGDEVLVPSMTFPATIQMIEAVQAKPVFCEVDPETMNLDAEDAAQRVTPNTRAVMLVHYGGYACDMERIEALASRHDLHVLEDAAHAFGSAWKGRKIGTMSDLTCFSFDPIKNITCGEGGAVATDDEGYASSVLLQRNLGISTKHPDRMEWDRPWKYSVESDGYRYAMPNLNASIGLAQMNRMDSMCERKRQVTAQYDEAFGQFDQVKLISKSLDESFPFSYVIRVLHGRRDALLEHLREFGIGAVVQFVPNHLQPRFRTEGAQLPTTEMLYDQILTLPLYADITDAEVEEVIETVTDFFAIRQRGVQGSRADV